MAFGICNVTINDYCMVLFMDHSGLFQFPMLGKLIQSPDILHHSQQSPPPPSSLVWHYSEPYVSAAWFVFPLGSQVTSGPILKNCNGDLNCVNVSDL